MVLGSNTWKSQPTGTLPTKRGWRLVGGFHRAEWDAGAGIHRHHEEESPRISGLTNPEVHWGVYAKPPQVPVPELWFPGGPKRVGLTALRGTLSGIRSPRG